MKKILLLLCFCSLVFAKIDQELECSKSYEISGDIAKIIDFRDFEYYCVSKNNLKFKSKEEDLYNSFLLVNSLSNYISDKYDFFTNEKNFKEWAKTQDKKVGVKEFMFANGGVEFQIELENSKDMFIALLERIVKSDVTNDESRLIKPKASEMLRKYKSIH